VNSYNANIKVQQWVVAIAIFLFIIKIAAFFITHSVAVLTDALESTVNVVAGFVGLYSLLIAYKPRDREHPYGHGKAEFLSAAVEGTLIFIAGLIIIYESVNNFINPHALKKIDWGMLLIAIAGLINFLMGAYAIRQGKKTNSLALIASGKHLQSDTYSTIGILIGLVLIYFTGLQIIDSIVAIIFAFVIMFTGYKILRESIAGIMDEADTALLKKLVAVLNANRSVNWIDLHNLRVIKFGTILHIDCHLTVPWYLNVHQAHTEIDKLVAVVKKNFGTTVEFFLHADGCLDFSCPICSKQDCPVRKAPYAKKIEWTMENVLFDKKHDARTQPTAVVH
jgi:cation diffusion facilitator family transporter